VRDNRGATSKPATAQITAGDSPPVPKDRIPASDARFSVGRMITLHGSALDAEDVSLPDSSLTWTVVLHHDSHTHPFLLPTTATT
jgi:hypothetical protein